jgi:hypothetical protein
MRHAAFGCAVSSFIQDFIEVFVLFQVRRLSRSDDCHHRLLSFSAIKELESLSLRMDQVISLVFSCIKYQYGVDHFWLLHRKARKIARIFRRIFGFFLLIVSTNYSLKNFISDSAISVGLQGILESDGIDDHYSVIFGLRKVISVDLNDSDIFRAAVTCISISLFLNISLSDNVDKSTLPCSGWTDNK